MRIFMFARFLCLSLLASLSLCAKESNAETTKVSEAFGHLIGKNLNALGMDFDMELVVKGMKDEANGQSSPMTEAECLAAINTAQEAIYKEKAKSNLEKAETFLKENAKNNAVVALEDGKVQYKIEKKGEGATVEPNFSPLIRYVGKYLDGSVFGQSQEGEVLSLEDSIPGFSKGLVGMHEGEKRTVYIHPELGYGTQGLLPPNSLLTFEIEVIKANSAEDQLSNSLIIESNDELKAPVDLDAPVVR